MILKKLTLIIFLFSSISITAFAADANIDDKAETETAQLSRALYENLESGNVSAVKYLLGYATSVKIGLANASVPSLCPPLSHVIGVRIKPDVKVQIAKLLLKHKASVNDNFGEESNAMRRAIRDNNLPMFELLLEHQAMIPQGLLDLAARLTDKTIAHKLLELKTEKPTISAAVWLNDEKLLEEAILHSKDLPGDLGIALEVAIRNENRPIAEVVLAKGAQPTIAAAAFLGNAEYLKLANVKAANPNAQIRFGNGRSPLQTALSRGHSEVADQLIRLGAKSHEFLEDAVREGDVDALQKLLECGANVRYVYRWGRSIVMLALESTKHETLPKMIELLLSTKPNLAQRDDHGDTVAHYAARLPSDHLALAILQILNGRTRFDRCNIKDDSPKDEALSIGNKQAAEYLTRHMQ